MCSYHCDPAPVWHANGLALLLCPSPRVASYLDEMEGRGSLPSRAAGGGPTPVRRANGLTLGLFQASRVASNLVEMEW